MKFRAKENIFSGLIKRTNGTQIPPQKVITEGKIYFGSISFQYHVDEFQHESSHQHFTVYDDLKSWEEHDLQKFEPVDEIVRL